ncbi:MAG: BatA domain-containing protein [Candidatus Binatia bacterium]
MPFYFLHPLYLYGLMATSIPLLIHLLNRRRLRTIRFPAVRFVFLSQRRITRSYRVRHWLLLALRTFAVLLLILLLAHPIFQSGIGLFAWGGPLSLVVVLDNSLSMKWSQEGQGYEQAKEAARLLFSSLREGDRAALVPTNMPRRRQIRFRDKKEALLRELDGIHISAATADFSYALSRAYELLKEPAEQKTIWLVTDMAMTGWDRFALSSVEEYDPLIPMKIIKLGKRGEPLNATIREIKVRGDGVAVGLPIHLDTLIVNFSNKEIKDLLVKLNLDNRNRQQRLVSLSPNEELKVGFDFNIREPGDHHGYVMLKKARIAGNPAAYFTLQAQEKLKVLIVDGDPQTSLAQSEAFFLTRALNPGGREDSSPFLPAVIIPEELNSVSLNSYQALIFCNVPVIPDPLLPRLRQYLRRGGGVLFFLGDRVQADDYNLKLFQLAPPILPDRIGDKRVLSGSGGEGIGMVDVTHPALRGLAGPLMKASLESTRVHGYFRTHTSGPSLLALANSDPLLLEKKMGSGRVLLFTTGSDRDWSDLPFKIAYLPLMQSLVSYLSGDRRGTVDLGTTAGTAKSFSFPLSYAGKSIRITKPDGTKRATPFFADGERAFVSFQDNDLAGVYRLSVTGQSLEQLPVPALYAVNPPFLESRLAEISADELQTKLHPIGVEVIPLDSLKKGGTRMDLSLPLLFLVIMTLASEGWLAQRIHE